MQLSFVSRLLFGSHHQSSASSSSVRQRYINKEARVEQSIVPGRKGRVYMDGSWWPARCDRSLILLPGTLVRVIGLRGITLLVEPKV
jgi:membrane protein implicated in regulation of membrane protease activity